ncbi:hypothetical protein BV898_03106 [Hypsibius exemplaris]|uniref:Uncharacterized protein n=1 Tax=Hypsibius exemplaris TaxID=2072580 RepID=A0A1W0X6N4_HYPEX|nr:hypothetical protein BV898_03106 [Hypsibius exemplaris]
MMPLSWNIALCSLVVVLSPWTADGFALRLYNSDFAVKPLENGTYAGVSTFQTARPYPGKARFLRLKPIELPAVRGTLDSPVINRLRAFPQLQRPMLWDDCTDYRLCKARLIQYLAARINEQKLNSEIVDEP